MSGNERLDVLVGALFVLIYVWYRFQVPATNRSSTTAARYYTAAVAYTLWGLGVYLAFVCAPDLLERFVPGLKAAVESFYGKGLSYPLIVALMLTIMLPKVGLLAAVDRGIRERLESMAAIPYEARRLCEQLAGSDTAADDVAFEVPEAVRAQVRRLLLDQDFQPEDIDFDGGPRLRRLWAKISVLRLHLEEWKRSRRSAGFCSSYADRLAEIHDSYAELTPRIKRCFRLMRKAPQEGGDVAGEYEAEVERQASRLLRRLYECLSAGVLHCELRQEDRTQRLEALGFRFTTALKPSPILMLHRLACLFSGLFVVLLVGFTVNWSFAGPVGHPAYSRIFGLSVMVALTYVIAVFWAVFPKEQRWSLAQREPTSGQRPVFFYLVAGLLAAASNAPVAFAWSLVKTQLWPSAGGVFIDFIRSLSWLLIGFTTAFVTALLIDDQAPSPLRRFGWWSEAAFQALTTAGAAGVALLLLSSYSVTPSGGPLVVILIAAAVGFVLGACVPTWFRVAPRTRPQEAVTSRPFVPELEPPVAALHG